MRPDALAAADRRRPGRRPAARSSCCATVGTTRRRRRPAAPQLGRDLPRARRLAARRRGHGRARPRSARSCAASTTASSWADSYCFNPHKWMFTNFDCDCFWVADRAALHRRAVASCPSTCATRPPTSGAVIDYRDWQMPLGRRFRALKLWFVIRHYGVEGLRHHVRRHVELAAGAGRLGRGRRPVRAGRAAPLNLVCFRHVGGDDANQRLLDASTPSGEQYLTHTRLDGRLVVAGLDRPDPHRGSATSGGSGDHLVALRRRRTVNP